MTEEVIEQIDADGGKMPTMVWKPIGDVRGGIVLIHGGYGLEPGVKRLAKRLSLVNYYVAAPDMYHREAGKAEADVIKRIANLTWKGAKADIAVAKKFVEDNIGLTGGPTAVMGFCMGGALAWLAAAELPFRTGIVYYPHEMFAPFGTGGPVPFEHSGKIKIPIMGHFGLEDTNPSPGDVQRLDQALSASNVPHQFCHYEGAGHGFVSANPTFNRKIPANTSIDRTVGWLDMQLRK